MAQKIALCLDELACRTPELIGLGGESLEAQDWIEVFSCGQDAREGVAKRGGFAEAWVVSCEDVAPINLAASMKADQPELHVCLVTPESCGSLLSRAHNALIDEVLEQRAFLMRYAAAKQAARNGQAQGQSSENRGIGSHVSQQTPTELAEEDNLAVNAAHAAKFNIRSAMSDSSSRAFVMPVVSGSGGAGKSSVAAIAALVARNMGRRTLLLDFDLQFGDVATMLGIEEPLRIDVTLAHPDQLEREASRNDRVAVLAAPTRLEAAEEVVRGLPALLEELAGLFDVIVVNTGATWAEQHAALLERSSAALFLVDQRASSVSACRHALELCARCGIATGPFRYALNRCAKGAPLTSVDVSCALHGEPVFELREGGRDVEDYLSGGAASELIETRNEFVKSVEQMMERLLPDGGGRAVERQPQEQGRRSLLLRGRHANRKRR